MRRINDHSGTYPKPLASMIEHAEGVSIRFAAAAYITSCFKQASIIVYGKQGFHLVSRLSSSCNKQKKNAS